MRENEVLRFAAQNKQTNKHARVISIDSFEGDKLKRALLRIHTYIISYVKLWINHAVSYSLRRVVGGN